MENSQKQAHSEKGSTAEGVKWPMALGNGVLVNWPPTRKRERHLICKVCQLSWCKYPHHVWFQTTSDFTISSPENCRILVSRLLWADASWLEPITGSGGLPILMVYGMKADQVYSMPQSWQILERNYHLEKGNLHWMNFPSSLLLAWGQASVGLWDSWNPPEEPEVKMWGNRRHRKLEVNPWKERQRSASTNFVYKLCPNISSPLDLVYARQTQ